MVLSRLSTPLAPARRAAFPAPVALAALVVLVALAVLPPGTARAVAPPDSGQRAVLGARCDSAGLVRVVTHTSTRMVQRLRLESDALVLPGARRVALIEVGEPPERRDTRIPWSEIESVSLGRSRTGQGALTGALVGAAVGGGIVGVFGPDLAETDDNAVAAFGVLVGLGCLTLGMLLGAANPDWTPVYP